MDHSDHPHDHSDHPHDHAGGDHDHEDQLTEEEQAARTLAAAHVLLDGLASDDMETAFGRLLDLGAVEVLLDEEADEIELDVSAMMEGVRLVAGSLAAELAARDGVGVSDVVAALRASLDATG